MKSVQSEIASLEQSSRRKGWYAERVGVIFGFASDYCPSRSLRSRRGRFELPSP
ncbi:hypothetical protein JW721_00220 [Candidatus Micrarchaeota archaeon]|nr:hypothetical protein [Candidatus Micrarchaeota archaeon]